MSQHNPLVITSESKRLRKVRWDANELLKKARFILIINHTGNIMVHENHDYAADVFAVLAPTEIDGCIEEQTLILEVGIGKGAPYSHTFRKNSRGENLSTDRRRVRIPNRSEQETIWKQLIETISRLTDEQISSREHQGLWFDYGPSGKLYAYSRGKRFSVSTDDVWIRDIILEAEFGYRQKKYLHKHSRDIRSWLKGCQFNYYSRKQARSFPKLSQAFDLLKNIQFRHPFILWRFIETLGKKKALVRNIADHFDFQLKEIPYERTRERKVSGRYFFIDRFDPRRGIIVFECPKEINFEPFEEALGKQAKTRPDEIPFHSEGIGICQQEHPHHSKMDDGVPF